MRYTPPDKEFIKRLKQVYTDNVKLLTKTDDQVNDGTVYSFLVFLGLSTLEFENKNKDGHSTYGYHITLEGAWELHNYKKYCEWEREGFKGPLTEYFQ